MHAREYDDDLVASVGGFADEASVVAGLARLHMADDEPTPIPCIGPLRVFEQPKDVVGRFVETIGHRLGQLGFLKVAVAAPVVPVRLAGGGEPIDVPGVVLERRGLAHPMAEPLDQRGDSFGVIHRAGRIACEHFGSLLHLLGDVGGRDLRFILLGLQQPLRGGDDVFEQLRLRCCFFCSCHFLRPSFATSAGYF